MTSSFGMGAHQATLEENVTLLNDQTSSSLTGRTSGLPLGHLSLLPLTWANFQVAGDPTRTALIYHT